MKTYFVCLCWILFLTVTGVANAQTANDATLLEFYQGQRYV